MNICEDFDLRHFNTFHVSARARWFIAVGTLQELEQALAWVRVQAVPFMLIGQGSNILFKTDYPGLIIELDIKGITLQAETADTVDVRAMCGEIWHDFVLHTLAQGWFGLENLSLIPGTVGAAPVQNIGAYGAEAKDSVLELHALEVATGSYRSFSKAECEFGYRDSIFKQRLKDRFIICSVTFRLHKTAQLNLSYPALQMALREVPDQDLTPQLVSATVCRIRSSKLPDHATLGNAGSFFWNPKLPRADFQTLKARFPELIGYPEGDEMKIPAAWLIEQAGWKGYREGEVGVHCDHALVLVNHGKAHGSELVALSQKIQASVLERFGIQLWPEVRIV
jgi:UDP-N-acetylmuramate dehydrogenase